MEPDGQILKCMPAYLEIRELFHISLSGRRNNFNCIDGRVA